MSGTLQASAKRLWGEHIPDGALSRALLALPDLSTLKGKDLEPEPGLLFLRRGEEGHWVLPCPGLRGGAPTSPPPGLLLVSLPALGFPGRKPWRWGWAGTVPPTWALTGVGGGMGEGTCSPPHTPTHTQGNEDGRPEVQLNSCSGVTSVRRQPSDLLYSSESPSSQPPFNQKTLGCEVKKVALGKSFSQLLKRWCHQRPPGWPCVRVAGRERVGPSPAERALHAP